MFTFVSAAQQHHATRKQTPTRSVCQAIEENRFGQDGTPEPRYWNPLAEALQTEAEMWAWFGSWDM